MSREENIREARRLRAIGWTAPQIGERLGVSDSTIRNWCCGGVCAECGAPTEGSNAKKARLCHPCKMLQQKASKIWTHSAIVEAIQRWATIHGRAPFAPEWQSGQRGAEYPAAGTVYRSSGNMTAPFKNWADAIEAAGFARPRPGHYERTPVTRQRASDSQRRRRARERAAA